MKITAKKDNAVTTLRREDRDSVRNANRAMNDDGWTVEYGPASDRLHIVIGQLIDMHVPSEERHRNGN